MILLPRHFFRYILREVRTVVGEQSYHTIFATAGREGAIEFCRSFRQHHDSTPEEAVEGYLAQASLRGWGTLSLLSLGRDRVEIRIKDSVLSAEGDLPDGHAMWEGVAQGVLIFLRAESGLSHSGVPDSSMLACQGSGLYTERLRISGESQQQRKPRGRLVGLRRRACWQRARRRIQHPPPAGAGIC